MKYGLLEELAEELERTLWWRSEKVAQYPNDKRNQEAAETLEKLSKEIRAMTGTEPTVQKYEAVCDFLFHDGDKDAENEGHSVCEAWNTYRSRIGFDHFPDSAADYLADLLECACEAAPSASYLFTDSSS